MSVLALIPALMLPRDLPAYRFQREDPIAEAEPVAAAV